MELITITDLRTIRDIAINFDQTRFIAFLNEVQEINLKELLGCKFYVDLEENTQNYDDLINGLYYTNQSGDRVKYSGLKPYISYHVLALISNEGDLFHTNKGNRNFLEQTSEIDFKQKNTIAKSYREKALIYRNNIIEYLDDQENTYTLWESRSKQNITNFTFQIV